MAYMYHAALHERERFYRFAEGFFIGMSILIIASGVMVSTRFIPVFRTYTWMAALWIALCMSLGGIYAFRVKYKDVKTELATYCDCL